MRPDEIAIAVDWAAGRRLEPPRLADAACFATVDADGSFIGELDGVPAAMVSCVNYDASFAFLGFCIGASRPARPRLRPTPMAGAAAHAGARVIGLDGVVAQQPNYAEVGVCAGLCQRPLRRRPGRARRAGGGNHGVDRGTAARWWPRPTARYFRPRARAFLRAWIDAPGHVGRALLRDGRLRPGVSVVLAARASKIGPLIADDRAAAETVLAALLTARGGGENLPRRPQHQPRGGGAGAGLGRSCRCSRQRACIPAPSPRCGSNGSLASPPSRLG